MKSNKKSLKLLKMSKMSKKASLGLRREELNSSRKNKRSSRSRGSSLK